MGKSISQLEDDVRWWEEEIRVGKTKVEEAERMLEQRMRELAEAQQRK